MIVEYIINKIIRRNALLYILSVFIYKKFTNFFFFVEKKNYLFLEKSKIKNILNIGSNHFQVCKIVQSLKKKLKCFCFDPIQISNNLNKNIKNIKFYNYGLGNKNREKLFYTPYYNSFRLDSLASFDKKNIENYIKKNLPSLKKKIYFIVKKIIIRKLDTHQIKFQFIKIDTEGFEYQIIIGGIKLIKKNNPIILLEVNKNLSKISRILNKIGYTKYIYNSKFNKFIKLKKIEKKFNDIFFLNKKSFSYLYEKKN